MSAAPKVSALRGGHVTLAAAADAFLAIPRTANPNTHRAYTSAIDRTIDRLGRERPVAAGRSPKSPTPRSAPRSPTELKSHFGKRSELVDGLGEGWWICKLY
ncbi:hypothetical protein [Nonomuraea sp. NEAU-A123]|uniref:hypothetical protein n=1 Tax=Nonomuraea sp. NEAU-A123 TaxID=2839649 RepID=UPI001BE437F8|nr:hypothetical protein [Nonomuraea sp. NEAU-A123]MBT2235502.1 hypothetical protein [Nonomuraea sp. NEAU-A123]